MKQQRGFQTPMASMSCRIRVAAVFSLALVGATWAATFTGGFGAGYDYPMIQRAIDAA